RRGASWRAPGTTSREGGRQMTTRPVAVLIGPPGAGKSTVGPLLAALLGAEFAETDQMVEEVAGKPVSDIFLTDGEPAFRDLERTAAARALAQHPGIVALGGGAGVDLPAPERPARPRAGDLQSGVAPPAPPA